MRSRKLALLLVAAGALCCTAAGAHGAMGGRGFGGFGHAGGFHRHPAPVDHFRLRFGRPIRAFAFRSFPDSSLTVAGDDDTYDYDVGGYDDSDISAMHFRAEDSFGPWDIPIRPVVAEPAWSGPWGAARMDPWHGYEPQDSW